MNEIPIYYKVPDASSHVDDVEKLLNAIGAYETSLTFPESHYHEAKVFPVASDAVMVGLIRTVKAAESQAEILVGIQTMREGVKCHLDECDQERLSAYSVDDYPAKA